ncbi:amino acid adenylation domain-containing protein, partial [Streptomyces sp. NPDC050704]|uniref:non-ribosomal peptide synthetase n=1 Tax=Streptomyces sp. NPDC050704 TaxID=3157219 RepID=UPI00342F68CA
MSTGEMEKPVLSGTDADALRAELLRRRLAGRRGTADRRPEIPRADRAAPLPLSYGQQQMWFLSRLEPDSPEYLVPLVLRLRGALDTDALDRAWQSLLERHEILRTRYVLEGDEPAQLVDAPRPLPLDRSEAADDDAARALVEGDLARPFDLGQDRPVRARLIRLADDEHILAVVFHHIACDAWSTGVFGQELSELYAGSTPAPLAVQYADYAAWQRAELTGEVVDRQLGYWRERLADLAPLDLPADRPRPAVRDGAGSAVPFDIPAPLATRLRELAARHDSTPFMLFLAAYQTLLARYTGRTDIAVGTVVSGRGRPELQRLIGYGINSLVMRGDLSGDPAFTDLLARTRATVLDAYDHQDVAFAQVVEALSPERDLSRTPLFQAAFTMHGERGSSFAFPGVEVAPFEGAGRVAKFDLDLQIREATDGSLTGHLEYATALFDRSTVERFRGHLLRLLTGITADPGAPVSSYEILDDAERAVLLGAPEDPQPVTRRVHEVFEEQVALTPERVAVSFEGTDLTYAEVNSRANRIAHSLIARGVGPETLVGLSLERGVELVPALLGILKSGAAYLPLDPANPADRIAYIVRDAQAPVVVTTSEYAHLFDVDLLLLDGDAETLAARPESDPAVPGSPENLIYTIYTSGSTGKPKGVALTHANVVRLLERGQEHYAFDETDVWPLFHSYAFDVSVWEMWGALLHGGRLVVVPYAVTRSPEEFLDLLVRERVTVLNQTPSAFRSLIGTDAELALRAVVFAGEKLEISELRPWTDRFGLDRIALVNMYGITETTVHTTYHRLTDRDLEPQAGNPVGRPLADLRVYLLDADGRLVPIGVPGEIHVGGPGVARGYLNRPELTAERFVPDPYGPAGSRLYRSGDLARRLPDGGLEFLGRIDDQVKIRGFRIELGEIETALAAHPQVRDAVVLVREDTPGDKRLVAYLTAAADAAPAPGELRSHLAAQLPEYMVPSAFVALDALPLTTNGKLDKRALPAPGQDALGATGHVAPRTVTEERIAEVWADVLGLDRVGVEDGFFDLGGHSIRAVALVGRLRAIGYDLAVRDVFEYRTVARVAELVTGRPAPADPDRTVEPFALLSDADRERLPEGLADAYPLSQVQLGMVVEMLTDDGKHPYHNVTSFRIRDGRPFSLQALRGAAAAVVARHEALRTSVDLTGYSVPLQLVHAIAEMPVGARDLSQLEGPELLASLREFTDKERSELFDLATPPLLRLYAHVTRDGSWWITNTECHAILDGWSHHSLLMEVLEEYGRIRDGLEPADAVAEPATRAEFSESGEPGESAEPRESVESARPAVRFADFIAAELDVLASEETRAYWRSVVDGNARLTVPVPWRGDPGDTGAPYRVPVPFHDLEDRLRALATKAGASFKSVLHAAHLKTLSMLTEEDRFFTGLVCNARPEVLGADRVYGMHLNTLPFAYDRTAATWRELVGQVFAREIELWPHRTFPMPVIQREFADGERLIDMRFSYHDFDQVDREQVDYLASIDDSPTEFPLGVSARVGHLVLTASPKALSRSGTDRLAAMLRLVLEAMAADPDGDARLAFLPAGERERQLTEWNDTSYGAEAVTVLGRFEEQAARTPGAVAVRHEGGTLSYGELDCRANQLAHHLRGLGVGAESRVLVRLDRGPDLLTALLAVWKAGGAYVPVDPSHPADRVAAMRELSGAPVTLTEIPVRALISLPTTAPARSEDLDRLAYVIFTSGSTGTPKGVEVSHRGLANHVAWAARELASQGGGGAPLFSSVAFDLVVPNLWAPLVTGQTVHTVSQDVDMADLGKYLADASPFSFVKLTPGHLDVLAQQLTAEQAAALAPVLVVAGEAFTRAMLERWRALAPEVRLINEYGPTEASVGTTVYEVPQDTGADVLPIGRPLPNMTTYVLDAALQPVPVGVTGELYVGGTGVARGYAGRPDLTAERFVPDPYGTTAGARLYRTGDLVRQLADGNVEFLGRIDDQVKIRGYRVELGEIQAVLAGHPDIRDAHVTTFDGELAGYYAPADAPAETVREHLAARLPDYMIPATLTPLEALPLNANGKIDRRALPTPDTAEAAGTADDGYVAPRTDTEERIATVWRRVLERETVGVEDDFFETGGHSIRAVALVGALRAEGFDIGVRDVFEYRTVARLSELLTGRPAPEAADTGVEPFALVPAADRGHLPGGLDDAYPLSQVQTGMAVEMLAEEGGNKYHNVSLFPIRDGLPLDVVALRAAARTLTARHDILRTSVELTAHSVPMQYVHTHADVPVTVRDLRDLDGADARTEAIGACRTEERTRLFDLSAAPLLRITALVEDDTSWQLVLTQPHLVTEGWSHHSLLMELLDCYRQFRDTGAPGPYTAPAVRYADFIAGELDSLAADEDRDFWQRTVDTHAPFALPASWADAPDTPRSVSRARVDLSGVERPLRALAAAARVSYKSVLHAAHLKVMSQLTDEEHFFTGIVAHGRPEAPGAERVYGMHLNTLPHPADRSARTWRELVQRTFAREAATWPHRRYPLPAVQRLAGGERLIDVVFNYLDFHQVDTERVDFGAAVHDAATEFGLHVSVLGGHLGLSSHTHALSQANAERLAGLYRTVLEAMAANPDGDARAAYLPPEERESLTVTTRRAPAAQGPVPEQFAALAARTPDAVALAHEDGETTYAELDARANRLAHHLAGLGVGPETVVAVSMNRGPDLITGILGILKAGGAYLPLDPAYPADRLTYMLDDSAAPVLLTERDVAPALPEHTARTVVVDDPGTAAAIAGQPSTAPAVELWTASAAYVIYTSGSTGRPKGVVVTHAGTGNLGAGMAARMGIEPGSRVLQFASISFDAAFAELAQTLLTGATLVLAPAERLMPGPELAALTHEQRVTHVTLPPTALSVLPVDGGLPAGTTLLVAGEACPPDTVAAWSADRVMINAYGPTETTVCATMSAPLSGAAVPPIGRPMPAFTTHVLDARMQPVPAGVPGELYLGGIGVARGYLGRPGLTAERFVPDPYATEPGTRLYRTGDLVRQLPSGDLQFISRTDTQIKLRGFRVELGEIETALAAHPLVRAAVADVREDVPGARTLAAYYVPEPGALPEPAELRDLLAASLPDHMVPASFTPLDAVPLSPTGKTDRRALPAPDRSAHTAAEAYTAPRTPVEERVAAVWSEVLGVGRVGVHDGFFDLGGDSIRAVTLIGALRAAGFDTGVREVFEARTVAALAELLTGRAAPAEPTWSEPFALVPDADRALLPGGLDDAYPLSQVQTGMVVEMLADGARTKYHNVSVNRIRDGVPFSAEALREAARAVVARHEVLRTSFELTAYSVPMQLVHTTATVPVRVTDLRDATTEERERTVGEFVAAEHADHFDLAAAPLLRVAAFVASDETWQLALTESHAITEGWSYHALMMELLDVYAALRDGVEPALPDLPRVRFADAVAAELAVLDSAESRGHWQDTLDTYPAFALPAGWGDTSTPPETYRVSVELADLEPGLRALATASRTSLKAVLHAAHLKVLSQLTPEECFHAGLVGDTRPEAPGADRVLGMYVNTVPFAHDRSAATWRELVRQVFDHEVALWPHRQYPLPAIQRQAGGQRLVDVVFNYQDFHQVDTDLVDVAAGVGAGGIEFGLAVTTLAGRLHLKSDTHRVSRAHAARLAAMYRAVLAAMAAGADGDAREVYLPTGERELQLADWTSPRTPGDRPEACVHEVFEERAARTPDAVAVTFGATHLTYAELNTRANRVAHLLRAKGVGPETLVGVSLERGTDLVAVLLGVLKAGGAYLPLDPAYPADRLTYIAEDAAAQVVVTTSAQAGSFTAGLVLLDTDAELLDAQPGTNPVPLAGPENLIYVIYTSGSTGRPKGVTLTHANVLRLFTVTEGQFGFGPRDVWTLFHSYAFDFSVWELWGALLYGGRLVVVEQTVARSPEDFLDLLVAERVTVLNQTPSAFRSLAAAARDDDPRIAELALRTVVFGGEKLEVAELKPWAERVGLATTDLVNMYGITETTVHVTHHLLTDDDLASPPRSPVGGPLADLRVCLLDRNGRIVPLGVPGEIHVGGPGVARGYLGRPELTAERFVPDPYATEPGARLYRAGDLARRLPDGGLEFLGRIDDQVKIRGFRIELGEISAALGGHPAVRDAVVVVREDTPGDKRLVGYFVPAGEQPPVLAELRAHLARELPDHMVPAAYVPIERIPLNANGKLNRRVLPAPSDAALAADETYTAPRTPVEERIAAVWREVLGAERAGAHDSFFDLGGDSIRAVALVGAMRAAGFDVAVREVFELRTVAGLAELLDGRKEPMDPMYVETRVRPYELITEADRTKLPRGTTDAYPLSQIQAGMVVELMADEGRGNYHNVTSFRITDDAPFAPAAFESAVRSVVARHDVLRTSVAASGYSVPLQIVHERVDTPLTVTDLRHTGTAELEAALRAYVAEERAALFDLSAAPLLRTAAHIESDSAWWLSVTESHVILEGWSHATLVMELLTAYREFRDTGGTHPYEQPPVRYADFIAGEAESLASADDRAYWEGVVERHAKLELPASFAEPAKPRESHRVLVALDDLAPRLRALASETGTSLKSVLHAAHLKVMSQLTGEQAFFTGLVTHARPEAPGAERVLGMHLNTLPFGHDRSARTWRELVGQVFARELEVWTHRRFPLPEIQRAARGGRLIDVLFNFVDFHQVDDELVDSGVRISETPTEFGLSVHATGTNIVLSTNTHVLGRAHAERLAGMYRAVLDAMAEDADGDARTNRLPAGERERLLGDLTPGTVEPVTRRVHEVFEEQVARTPERVAVSFEGTDLTYAEVNARANRIAHSLIARGVGPESLVGLSLERGVELVPALLGILKSGAAYLPLDPANPADRIAYIVRDAQAPVVVTTAGHAGLFDVDLLLLDADAQALARLPETNPGVVGSPENLIYTIYTSGSTGKPKGVALTHANVVRLLERGQEHYAFDETDVWPLFHSYAFDVSVWEMWGALLHGGRLVVVPYTVTRSPDEFLDLLVDQEVTVLNQTPSAFRSLVAAAADGDRRVKQLSLRAVVFAGEKLEISELRPWTDRLGLARTALVNMYGITETTVHTTYHRLTRKDLDPQAGNAIGRPLADLRVHLLDVDGQLVPIGVPGEIHVGGPGVARGYLNRPELTAERFVPDPYGPAGSRLYRSGDLARRLPDGGLEFLGRIDDQVKIRG